MSGTYKRQFAEKGRARAYDAGQYGENSYSSLLWELEKEFLARFLEVFRQSVHAIDYLDFACGSGRVISFVEQFVDRSTGVDISQEMLASAASRVKRSLLLRRDLAAAGQPLEGKYDLITSFRFFLNAEPALRLAAICALAARLKDDTSRLIFNNHGNPFSHKLPVWPFHQLRRLGGGYHPAGNYLTHGEIRRLIDSAGLSITETHGFGYLSAKAVPFLGYGRVLGIEKALARRRYLDKLGVNRLYVCRLRS
jgi:SAM-dependent methyltransferase